MSEQTMRRHEPSGWAIGFTSFAALALVLVGFFHAITGFSAIVQDQVFMTTQSYVFNFDVTTWGWIHIIVGLVVITAGFALFMGAVWARTIGVIIAAASAVANFAFLPIYPLWAVLIIALDIAVIWALTTHGRDITMER